MPELTFLQINDLHGYVSPHPEMIRAPGGDWHFTELGGLARIAALFDTIRNECKGRVIALDNGDTFHGTHVAVKSRGKALIPMMNALGLDAMTNCHDRRDDRLLFEPYKIVERSGLRVAVIGLACPIVDKTMPPSFSTGVYFTIGNVELPRWIKHVREEEKADLIVVLSHLGFPQDVKLAGEVDGIDVIVSGHTHNRMEHAISVNGAIIFQSGCHGSFVGRLDVVVDGGKITSHKHSLIAVNATLGEQPEMARLVEAALKTDRAALAEVVGSVGAPLHRYAMLNAPMDDVLLEAVAAAAGTDIAFSNGWRYGAPIEAGDVTVNDLWNIIPTNPPVSTVELTGSEIAQMIEENLERTFASDPYEQMGGFLKRMRGLRLYFKAENPKGHRIDRLYAGNEAIVPDRVYTVAYVTAQGVPEKFGRNRRSLEVHAVDALRALFKREGTIIPPNVPSVYEV